MPRTTHSIKLELICAALSLTCLLHWRWSDLNLLTTLCNLMKQAQISNYSIVITDITPSLYSDAIGGLAEIHQASMFRQSLAHKVQVKTGQYTFETSRVASQDYLKTRSRPTSRGSWLEPQLQASLGPNFKNKYLAKCGTVCAETPPRASSGETLPRKN